MVECESIGVLSLCKPSFGPCVRVVRNPMKPCTLYADESRGVALRSEPPVDYVTCNNERLPKMLTAQLGRERSVCRQHKSWRRVIQADQMRRLPYDGARSHVEEKDQRAVHRSSRGGADPTLD